MCSFMFNFSNKKACFKKIIRQFRNKHHPTCCPNRKLIRQYMQKQKAQLKLSNTNSYFNKRIITMWHDIRRLDVSSSASGQPYLKSAIFALKSLNKMVLIDLLSLWTMD